MKVHYLFLGLSILLWSTLSANIQFDLVLLQSALMQLALGQLVLVVNDVKRLEDIVVELNRASKKVENEGLAYPAHEYSAENLEYLLPQLPINRIEHEYYKQGLLDIARRYVLPQIHSIGLVHQEALRSGKRAMADFILSHFDVVHFSDHIIEPIKFKEALQFIIDHLFTDQLPPSLLYFSDYTHHIKDALVVRCPYAYLVPLEKPNMLTANDLKFRTHEHLVASYRSQGKIRQAYAGISGIDIKLDDAQTRFLNFSGRYRPLSISFACNGDALIGHIYTDSRSCILFYDLAGPEFRPAQLLELPEEIAKDVAVIDGDPWDPNLIWLGTNKGELWTARLKIDGGTLEVERQGSCGADTAILCLRWDRANQILRVVVTKPSLNSKGEERHFVGLRNKLSLNQMLFLLVLEQFEKQDRYIFGDFKPVVQGGLERFFWEDDINLTAHLLRRYGFQSSDDAVLSGA